MPKPKATDVIVHRLDMQPSLKDSFAAFLIGKTATNAVSAIGSVLLPFSGAIGALAAAWIAKEGIESAFDTVTDYFLGKGEEMVDEKYGPELQKYKLTFAFIQSCTSVNDFSDGHNDLMTSLGGGKGFVKKKWLAFIRARLGDIKNPATQWPKEVAQWWKAFYPPQAFMKDVKGDLQSDLDKAAAVTGVIPNWLYKTFCPRVA